jgi:hypothetical protein
MWPGCSGAASWCSVPGSHCPTTIGYPAEAAMRSRALGVPVDERQLFGTVLRARDPSGVPGISAHARVLEAADVLAEACRAERIPALVGTLAGRRPGRGDALADPRRRC